MNQFLKALQVKASLCVGWFQTLPKHHLPNPQATPHALYSANGHPVSQADSSKFLGTQASWDGPSKVVIEDRKKHSTSCLLETAVFMAQQPTYSRTVKIFHSIVSALTYSLDTPTLELHHFITIDVWYHRFLYADVSVSKFESSCSRKDLRTLFRVPYCGFYA